MFRDTLREIVERTEGGVAGLIMDSEGIAVESYARADGGDVDITTIGVEFGVVLGAIRRATDSLEAGPPREIAIGTDALITILRPLGDSYFVAVAIRADGNFGKGRFLVRAAAPTLLAELE